NREATMIANFAMSLWLVCSFSKMQAPTTTDDVKSGSVFGDIIASLLQKTHVPPRLPKYVRYDLSDKDNPLYSTVTKAGPEDYSIELSLEKDCNGSHRCHWGSVEGSKTPPPSHGKSEVSVVLKGGIPGAFVDFDCDTYCGDSFLR